MGSPFGTLVPSRTTADEIAISSPKRDKQALEGWEGFFPYYAGFPARFASEVIRSACPVARSSVLDPWNGSGTTTYAAAQLGHTAIGFDLNPVMIVIARARMLPPTEADSLVPLCKEVLRGARIRTLAADEPLANWFEPEAARYLRAIERSIQRCLVGTKTQFNLDYLSSMAATFYSALFSLCRSMTEGFHSSNPTWMRVPRAGDARVGAGTTEVAARFAEKIKAMSDALTAEAETGVRDVIVAACRVGDSTRMPLQESSIDLVLGSPPYCTRIDYTAATRVELAVLSSLTSVDIHALGRKMIGSTRVPAEIPICDASWGATSLAFIEKLRAHPSKASAGYYYKTHADYFDKMARSMGAISTALRVGGKAVLVVQDSYYKEIHNNLPQITVEMAQARRLTLTQRHDFDARRSMGSVNRASRKYKSAQFPIESVLCFKKTA